MVEENKDIWIMLDEDSFVDGWSSTPQENFLEVKKPTSDFSDNFSYYKFENNKIIFDDGKILKETKKRIRDYILEFYRKINKVEIRLEGETFYFIDDAENKSFLQKVYYLCNDNIITETFFNLENEKGEIVVKNITKVNINELWLLSFLKDEEINKKIKETLNSIDGCKTMNEIISFKNNFNGGILND